MSVEISSRVIHVKDGNTYDSINALRGDPGEGVPEGGTTGQVLKKSSNTDYDTEWANETGAVTSVAGKTGAVTLNAGDMSYDDQTTYSSGTVGAVLSETMEDLTQLQTDVDGKVDDVQIDGTSIVDANNVANIPVAISGGGFPGLIKIGNVVNGLAISTGTGNAYVIASSSSEIKSGSAEYKPVVPYRQHESTFYGLAKAAGDSTQSASSNAVGTYTDAAKIAIQKMLGIYEAPWELIREDTFINDTVASPQITVDSNGNSFELTDVILLLEMPTHDSESKIQNYIQLYDGSTEVSRSAYINTTLPANSAYHGLYFIVEKKDNLIFSTTKPMGASSNGANLSVVYRQDFTNIGGISEQTNYKVTKVSLAAITGKAHYKLYGKRKWQ